MVRCNQGRFSQRFFLSLGNSRGRSYLNLDSRGEWLNSNCDFIPFYHASFMATRLYVGNLPYSTTDAELREVFEKAGEVVKAEVLIDRMTNRSRGFGFVEMASDDGAAKAIEMFNGFEHSGRKLVVNEARPRMERNDRFGN